MSKNEQKKEIKPVVSDQISGQQLLALKQILLGCQKQIALAQKTVNEFLGVDLPQAGFNAIINGEQTAKTGSAKRIKERRKKDDADPFHVEKFPNGDEVIEGVFNGRPFHSIEGVFNGRSFQCKSKFFWFWRKV